eukprot:GDKJ01047778.1.p1 GENE.GDKJ01047778.1~~GDKJ01047778.1.p1  ORF type:complete len:340 (-),score=63.86 GDKJ01047778.1:118-1137(-)
MHPDYEKLGKSLKGMARIIAVNGDAHKELSSQFGIKGFPTIKYYGMGDKAKAKPQDYQGERKFGPMNKMIQSLVKNDNVITVKKVLDVAAQIDKAGKVAILLSNKNSIPPMWAVVAGSAQLSAIKFTFSTDKNADIVKALEVTSFPTIAVVSKNEEGGYAKAVYSGAIEYDGIAKFILSQLNGESAPAAEEGAEGSEDTPKKEAPKKEPSNPKIALPLVPTAFTKHTLEFFCSSKTLKIKGQSPLCVIALNEERNLADVHAKYSNEPVLFFFADESEEVEKLSEALGTPLAANDVLLIRPFKEVAKYTVMKEGEDLDAFLGKVLEGTVSFTKTDSFPKL